jgi:hypothetical protein
MESNNKIEKDKNLKDNNDNNQQESLKNISEGIFNSENPKDLGVKGNMFEQSELFLERASEEDKKHLDNDKKNVLDDEEEYKHLKEIVSSFYNYQVIFKK